MTDKTEIRARFLKSVDGVGFWHVCHGPICARKWCQNSGLVCHGPIRARKWRKDFRHVCHGPIRARKWQQDFWHMSLIDTCRKMAPDFCRVSRRTCQKMAPVCHVP